MEEGDILLCLVFSIFVIVCDILTGILIKYHASILFIHRNILTYLNLTLVVGMCLALNFLVFLLQNLFNTYSMTTIVFSYNLTHPPH